jgi:beta-hydroxylase
MLHELISVKFIILYVFIISAVYMHFRGKVRFKFFRQLFDHSTFMAPINFFMYLFSAIPNRPYIDAKDFPQLKVLNDNWKVFRDEAKQLVEQSQIKASDKYNDIGFNSFFRKGWKRFYLKWYDEFLPSAVALCPKTVELLKTVPSVNAAMFALLPKDGVLTKHRDPYAGSVRYHLGLVTPNSEQCYISVDGVTYYWKDGEAVMFDETYIHYAENRCDMDRIILFCDIERPLRNRIAIKINHFFCKYMMAAAATKNADSDRVGGINKAFKYLYSIRLVGKKLKAFNKPLYYTVKYILFGAIFYLIFFKA